MQTWGWSLLTVFLALLVGAMIVVIAKRLVFGARGVGSKQVKRRATDTRSAWEESGRRMGTPESDLKEEP